MVRKDDGINTIEQLIGKKILCTNQQSIAGYMFFRNKMARLNLHAPDDYTITFNGNVETLPFLLINGKYDALIFSEDKYVRSGIYNQIRNKLKIIDHSFDIPRFPFAVSNTLDSSTVIQIQDAITGLNKDFPTGSNVLKSLNIEKFITINDSYYNEFREEYELIKKMHTADAEKRNE